MGVSGSPIFRRVMRHATATLLVGVIERHDRERFEVTVLNNEARDHSPDRSDIGDAVEAFVDVLTSTTIV